MINSRDLAELQGRDVGDLRFYDRTLSVAAASFIISNIPPTRAHIELWIQARSDQAAILEPVRMQFNGITSATYDVEDVFGTGGLAGAAESLAATSFLIGFVPGTLVAQANAAGCFVLAVPNYAGKTFNKGFVSHAGFAGSASGDDWTGSAGGNNRAVTPVGSITIFPTAGNFVAGSRCTCYLRS